MRLSQLLAAKGVHYLVTRFGPARLRGLAFDEKYRRGDWKFQEGAASELRDVVQRHLRGGDLLVLGCGGASILEGLEAGGLNSALGIDLSAEAIRLAGRYASGKVTFQQANMVEFPYARSYDVILFSESLNYLTVAAGKTLLRRLCEHLKPGGVFVVTFAQAERYRDIIEMIRDHFEMITDRKFATSTRHLLVFSGEKAEKRKSREERGESRNHGPSA